jgi:hypothetical protein
MPNNPNAVKNLRPFVKGDKRINRKGRPRSFDALRSLAQMIAKEAFEDKEGNQATRVELILREWSTSHNALLQKQFVEVAYGKVPDEVINSGEQRVEVIVKHSDRAEPTHIAPETDGDLQVNGEAEDTG